MIALKNLRHCRLGIVFLWLNQVYAQQAPESVPTSASNSALVAGTETESAGKISIRDYKEACAEKEGPKVRLLVGLDVFEDRLNQLLSDFKDTMEKAKADKTLRDYLQKNMQKSLLAIDAQAKKMSTRFMSRKLDGAASEVFYLREIENLRILSDFHLKLSVAARADLDKSAGIAHIFLREAKDNITKAWSRLKAVDATSRATRTPGILARVTESRINYEQHSLLSLKNISITDKLIRLLAIVDSAQTKDMHVSLHERAELAVIESQVTLLVATADPGTLRIALYMPGKWHERFSVLVASLPEMRQELSEKSEADDYAARRTIAEIRVMELITPFFLADVNEWDAVKNDTILNAAKKAVELGLESADEAERQRAANVVRILAKEEFGTELGKDFYLMARRYQRLPEIGYADIHQFYTLMVDSYDTELMHQLGPVLYDSLKLPTMKEIIRSKGFYREDYQSVLDSITALFTLVTLKEEAKEKKKKVEISDAAIKNVADSLDRAWSRLQCSRVSERMIQPEDLKQVPSDILQGSHDGLKPKFSDCVGKSALAVRASIANDMIQAANQKYAHDMIRDLWIGFGVDVVSTVFIIPAAMKLVGEKVAEVAVREAAKQTATRLLGAALARSAVRFAGSKIAAVGAKSLLKGVLLQTHSGFKNFIQIAVQGELNIKNLVPPDFKDKSVAQFAVQTVVIGAANEGMGKVWKLIGTKMPVVAWSMKELKPGELRALPNKDALKYILGGGFIRGTSRFVNGQVGGVAGLSVESAFTRKNQFSKILDKLTFKEILLTYLDPKINPADNAESMSNRLSSIKLEAKDLRELGECRLCLEAAEAKMNSKIPDAAGP